MPFGEDLNVGVGNRTSDTGLKYSMPGDDVRQKFTGYQKDTETQLDFAVVRISGRAGLVVNFAFGRWSILSPAFAGSLVVGEVRTARQSLRRSAIWQRPLDEMNE